MYLLFKIAGDVDAMVVYVHFDEDGRVEMVVVGLPVVAHVDDVEGVPVAFQLRAFSCAYDS